jgi:cytochrome c biogenesis protein CcdA
MPRIEKEFKGRIQVEYRDLTDVENYKLLLALKEKNNSDVELTPPVFYFEGRFLDGRSDFEKGLRDILTRPLTGSGKGEGLPSVDLLARFKAFRVIGVMVAGLEDGINPCAFTVIVFFISYLALQGYRKRELIVIGLSFISAVFLTYFLIGLGLFNIFYSLGKFLLIRKTFNISIGIFSIILGVLSVYDFIKFKKTGQTEGMILQLPQAIKNRIHSIIGLHYRKTGGREGQRLFKLIISAIVTGFLVSSLELVCTGQLYLPTINFVLKAAPFKLQALTYLLLYNLMFITPLLVIFLLALLGVTSEQFAKVLKRHLPAVKVLMAALFFGLGAFLLWRP